MTENPYFESCGDIAENLKELNDTLDTAIEWRKVYSELGETEKKVYNDQNKLYDQAKEFRDTIHRKIDNGEIESVPKNMPAIKEEIDRAEELKQEYDQLP